MVAISASQKIPSWRHSKKEPAEVNVADADSLKTQASCGIEVELRTEADECWSSVEKKSNQRWTWYAIDRSNGVILAHQNGRRTDDMCEHPVAKLEMFPIAAYDTDDWHGDTEKRAVFLNMKISMIT